VLVRDPDLPGCREQLAQGVARVAREGVRCAALGPTVAPAEAALSLRRARESLRLRIEGVLPDAELPDAELLRSDDHLLALLLHRDSTLAMELVHRRLTPLAGLAVGSRERLEATLLAWLRHQGNIPPVAEELRIHRQTVRYRLGRLRELFGAQLDSPDARLEIELALRIAAARPDGLEARTIKNLPYSDSDL
jgi:DNA-binding PucR family transcriptional regulator